MSILAPGSVPAERQPWPNGINEDLLSEWHCRVPDPEICMVVDDTVLYRDGVGFTDWDEIPIDPNKIPAQYLTAEFQAQLGRDVTALRTLGSTAI